LGIDSAAAGSWAAAICCRMGTMEQLIFNYASTRAKKARYAHVLMNGWVFVAVAAAVAFFLLGVSLLALQLPVGWLLLGVSAVPAMIAFWYKWELKQLKPSDAPSSIDAV